MKHVLFVCSRNRRRSPTAEQVFRDWPDIETASAGLKPDADEPLTPEMIDWADLICVMESGHRRQLSRRFAGAIRNKRVVSLDIPDDYDYMAPELVARLKARVPPLLR